MLGASGFPVDRLLASLPFYEMNLLIVVGVGICILHSVVQCIWCQAQHLQLVRTSTGGPLKDLYDSTPCLNGLKVPTYQAALLCNCKQLAEQTVHGPCKKALVLTVTGHHNSHS